MDVHIQGGAKTLDSRHGSAAAAHTAPPSAPALEAEHGADDHRQHRAAEAAVLGHSVPQPVQQREHPLAHGQTTRHAIHQVRRQLGHAHVRRRPPECGPATARRAEAAPAALA